MMMRGGVSAGGTRSPDLSDGGLHLLPVVLLIVPWGVNVCVRRGLEDIRISWSSDPSTSSSSCRDESGGGIESPITPPKPSSRLFFCFWLSFLAWWSDVQKHHTHTTPHTHASTPHTGRQHSRQLPREFRPAPRRLRGLEGCPRKAWTMNSISRAASRRREEEEEDGKAAGQRKHKHSHCSSRRNSRTRTRRGSLNK